MNDVELAAFILPKDLNKVVNERVVIVNETFFIRFVTCFSPAKVGNRGKINYFWLLTFIV